MEWYSVVYRASYRLGFTPWDRGKPAAGLVDLVEGPMACGPGEPLIWAAAVETTRSI